MGAILLQKHNISLHKYIDMKYQKKAGYMAKSFKLKRDIVEQFEEACRAAGVSQAAQITKMMNEFIEEQKQNS